MSLYPRKVSPSLPEGLRSPYLGWPPLIMRTDSGNCLQRGCGGRGGRGPQSWGLGGPDDHPVESFASEPSCSPASPWHTVGLPGRVTHESFLRHSGESLERQCHHAAMYQRQGFQGCRVSGPAVSCPIPSPGVTCLLKTGEEAGRERTKQAPSSQAKRREITSSLWSSTNRSQCDFFPFPA